MKNVRNLVVFMLVLLITAASVFAGGGEKVVAEPERLLQLTVCRGIKPFILTVSSGVPRRVIIPMRIPTTLLAVDIAK